MIFAPIEWLSRLVLLLLVALSIWSIAIIIERRRFYKNLLNELDAISLKDAIRTKDKKKLTEISQKKSSFLSKLIQEILPLESADKIENAFLFFIHENKAPYEKGLSVLGTLGSTTPFIGLLGTILGIIVSFGKLSQGEGSTNDVMFSLAEALILTAAGLMVAIPAVVAFNYFSKQMKTSLAEAASLKDLYIAYKD